MFQHAGFELTAMRKPGPLVLIGLAWTFILFSIQDVLKSTVTLRKAVTY